MTSEGQAVAGDGARLRFQVQGRGPLRFALTHSLGMTGAFWQPLIGALGNAATVLTWDCRGHGASDKPAGPYTAEMFGDDVAAVFDAAGWDRAICAGASMGGVATLAFAVGHPDRVSALGLIDTTASYGADAPQAWESRAQQARQEGLRSLTAFQQTRWFGDAFRAARPDVVDRFVEIFCANDVDAYTETCRMLGNANLVSKLPAINVPTAIVVGEEDYATPPEMAELMHAKIAGSSLDIIPGARHLTPVECPEFVADRLLALGWKVAR